ncbi:MAG: hypothetical protein GXO32_08375 [Crenarchaeota archaeon]|nr:hypothetical protein [Thermoproteota archaeon]
MSSIDYRPDIDTLIIKVGFEAPQTYVPISDDIEVGLDSNGRIVEFRVSAASRKGLKNVIEIVRRRRRRLV